MLYSVLVSSYNVKSRHIYYLCMVLVFGHDLKNEVFHD